jgi:uncharacterized Rmd1/YagE family protein
MIYTHIKEAPKKMLPSYDTIQTSDASHTKRCTGYCSASSYDIKALYDVFYETLQCDLSKNILHGRHPASHAEVFYFSYGVVVLWGFTKEEEVRFIDIARPHEEASLSSLEYDEFEFTYGDKQRLHRDLITLSSDLPLQKLAVSHGIAQSIKLTVFETSIQEIINKTKHLPENLAKKGKIPLRRKEIAQKMGQLFLERSSVNLHFDILDTPDIFWEYDEVEPLYQAARSYLDIPKRVDVLNHRLDIVNDLFEMLGNELNHQHSSFLEWVIIWLIVIEVVISLVKDVFQLF